MGNLFHCTLFIVKGKLMLGVVGLSVSETSVVSACCFQMNSIISQEVIKLDVNSWRSPVREAT